jgi:flagellar biosynthetic protein FlhB
MAEGQESDDRTEEPTQRRLDKAIERGDVPKSIEVNTWFVLGGFGLAIVSLGGPVSRDLAIALKAYLMNAHAVPDDGRGLMFVGRHAFMTLLTALSLPLGLILLAALGGSLIQHKPLWTFEPLMPQFSRISPGSGFKRIFGKEAFVQFIKGLVKIAVVGVVVSMTLWGQRDRLAAFVQMDAANILPATQTLIGELFAKTLAILAFLAMGDFVYQRVTWQKRQRMTKQELKEEYKETEGSPETKNRIRQIRATRFRKRMMSQVPQATVVIANPTHFAVALKYEAGMPAPICVAKGMDGLALRIRALAEENGVPVVENPPLARALHATVKVDEEIPVEHYKLVAEVIGYVLRLRRRTS